MLVGLLTDVISAGFDPEETTVDGGTVDSNNNTFVVVLTDSV